MLIDLEEKCTATHDWVLVAAFFTAAHANDAARAMSKGGGGTYRVIDRRWPDAEAGPGVNIYKDGEAV